jgi:cell division protein FtsX
LAVSPATVPYRASGLVHQPLTDGHFTIFGFQVQGGMLIALAIIAVAIAFAWLANR